MDIHKKGRIMKSRNLIASALALGMLGAAGAAQAATYSIADMNITGGGLGVDGYPDGFVSFSYIGPNTNLVGGYIGSGGGGVDLYTPNPVRIAEVSWYNQPLSLYTAPANLGDMATPAGTVLGGPVPTGVVDDVSGTISLDLSSLFGNWADGDYTAGTGRNDGTTSLIATGTWDPVTRAYTLSWDSIISGPTCAPCIGHLVLQGTASPVPLPAAVWLFGSGLLGLLAASRRRRFS